jgi:hypothetical protein
MLGRASAAREKKPRIRIRLVKNNGAQELRSRSPRRSEEQVMTIDGPLRISDVQREVDGMVKELAVSGAGTYTGINNNNRPRSPRRGGATGLSTRGTKSATMGRSLNESSTRKDEAVSTMRPTTPKASQPSAKSNINNFRDTGFDFFDNLRADPSITVNTNTEDYLASTGRSRYPERYYSESVYPDAEFQKESGEMRDYNSERMSKYGDRRFGVVTPKGTTPTNATTGWAQSGRPF